VVAAAAGVALLVAGRQSAPSTDPNLVLLRGDADKVAAAIESGTHAAQLRADGLAQAPMLRAGVETDAATVRDMMHADFSLQLAPGETFELLQDRDGATSMMLRIPDGPALAVRADRQPRLHVDGAKLVVLVSSPVTTQHRGIGGTVVLAVPIDLAPVTTQLAAHASNVTLRGLDAPIALVPAAAAGSPTDVPLALPKELGASASLTATLPPVVAPPDRLGLVRLACWGLAGILGIAYLVNLLRARRQG
jgi:hypothetical protein